MSDFYAEKLVKRKTGIKEIVIKFLMILLTVAAVLSVFVTILGVFAILLMIGLDILIFWTLDVEYEYQYINGYLDVDKIIHKQRRRNLLSLNVGDMELLAPSGEPKLDAYGDCRFLDYASGEGGKKTYEMILEKEGMKIRMRFEPDEDMVEGIRMRSPSKVV